MPLTIAGITVHMVPLVMVLVATALAALCMPLTRPQILLNMACMDFILGLRMLELLQGTGVDRFRITIIRLLRITGMAVSGVATTIIGGNLC